MIRLFLTVIIILSFGCLPSVAQNIDQKSMGNCSPNISNSKQANVYCNTPKTAEFRSFQATLYTRYQGTDRVLGAGPRKINPSDIKYELLPVDGIGSGSVSVSGSLMGDTVDLSVWFYIPSGRGGLYAFGIDHVHAALPKSGALDTQLDLRNNIRSDVKLPGRLIVS